MGELVRKAILASLLIGLGDYILLKIGTPIGPFLFSLGLLAVCYMGANLFTGKCGFLFEDNIKLTDLGIILAVNLISGYLLGAIFGLADADLVSAATSKISGWEFSFPFLVKAVLCGVVMFVAVYIYRKGSPFGVLIGVPLFIFAGFQHCIANVITMGVALSFDWSIFLAVVGNFVGSILAWWLFRPNRCVKTEQKRL
ncbi:MAG: formate/nitrite transporter family protein [Candidatus Saccharibacteria bacterium]|nr:formate/nitrite transporter family protein [Candidatus Saccharibacteria bacterium]